eukprot:Skav209863  [mRNA]  locus=scaffold1684:532519:535351:- [translate_table: standard]
MEWMYSAKHKSHWRPIVGLCFAVPEPGKQQRLFSVGEDRRLVEYTVKSSEFGGLQVVSPDTVVEQEARPTGCMWYPYCGGKGDNQKVLTMNDEYKFKIWNTARVLDGMIPVKEIPHLMCEYVDRIGFDDLVKLYVNHRPVFAVGPEQIKQVAGRHCHQG